MTKSYDFIFLQPGDKVILSHRRLFPNDKSRFFLGTVLGFNEANGLLKISGFSITLPVGGTHFVKKAKANVKIVSLTAGTIIAYQLPEAMDIDSATMVFKEAAAVLLEDKHGHSIDLTE